MAEDRASEIAVIVADDDDAVRRAITREVQRGGFHVDAYADGAEAIERVRRGGVEAVVSDISMPRMDGIELLRQVRGLDLDLPVILITGAPSVESAIAAVEFGAMRYLPKPVAGAALREAVEQAVQMHRLARVRRELAAVSGADQAAIGDRAGLEVRFARAMEQLFLIYQPVVAPEDKTVFGYEALARSREESLRLPLALFDTAERLGRLVEIGRSIRRLAPRAMAAMHPAASLFVNLHPRDLLDEGLYASDGPLSGVATRVVLEITERARLEQVPDVKQRIQRLRSLGFRIALDDIGAGYAGLASFTNLDPDIVKLDMDLVRDIDGHTTKQRLVAALVQLCHSLGMLIIAEGVETTAEHEALRALGVELFQGYLFARPNETPVEPNWS